MNNTLLDGDKVFVNKIDTSISRNEILIFKHLNTTYIKRCIGLPNDKVEIKNGQAFVNDNILISKAELKLPVKTIPGTRTSSFNLKNDNRSEMKGEGFDISIFNFYGMFWTPDNFGPLIIPKKGGRLEIDSKNLPIYKEVIISEGDYNEGSINKLVGKFYIFKKDYYFMLGDNRLHSNDSRMFGPISKENIVGKSRVILYSKNDLLNTSRILKSL